MCCKDFLLNVSSQHYKGQSVRPRPDIFIEFSARKPFPLVQGKHSTLTAQKMSVLLALNQCFKIIQFKREIFFLSFLVQLHVECTPSKTRNTPPGPEEHPKPLPFILRLEDKLGYFFNLNVLNHVYFHIEKGKIVFDCFAYV